MKAYEKYNFYFLLIILVILLYLTYLIVKELLIALFLGSFFALVFYPFYTKLNKKFYKPTLNSLFIVIIVNLFMLLVVIITSYYLVEETSSIVVKLNTNFLSNSNHLSNSFCHYNFCHYYDTILNSLYIHSKDLIIKLNEYVYSMTYKIFNAVTGFLIGYFIFVLSFFFFLRDGETFINYIDSILPMKSREKRELYKKMNDVIHAVFVDSLLIAFIQGSLVGLMFWILGLSAPVLWTMVASFFALIPTLGTFLVWLPAVIYLFIKKEIVSAIILFLWGSTVVSYIDNLLRPMMINSKIKVHSFLIFLSILGGMDYFGLIGLFLGPIIITLLILFFKFIREDFYLE